MRTPLLPTRATLSAIVLSCALAAVLFAALGSPAQPQEAPSPPRGSPGQAVREFLGLGAAPDGAAAARGAPVFAANCAFCHGPQARGASAPSLVYSELVLQDEHGGALAPFLADGRPDKGMPAFASLSDAQRRDLAEFLHQQVEDIANRGTYQIKDIVKGDAAKGAAYVAAHCLSCHSLSGDLKGLGQKWRPADLQRNWIMPPRTSPGRAITATVRAASGSWQGRVRQIDDFRIVLIGEAGATVVISRDDRVTVELHDPLSPHVEMIGQLKDADMINVTAYLETLR